MAWMVDMITNPETGATKQVEVAQEYLPLRNYGVEVGGVCFNCDAVVNRNEKGDAEMTRQFDLVYFDWESNPIAIAIDDPFMLATPKDASDSFNVLLQRAICEEACKPANDAKWVTEYAE